MYCLKCRRITETEYITTVTSKNGKLMRRGQCVTCGKIKCKFVKKEVAGGSFLNALVNKLCIKATKKFTDDLADELYKPVTR